MIDCIVALGSNYGTVRNLAKARDVLRRLYPRIAFSQERETEAVGMRLRQAPFLNQLAWLRVEDCAEADVLRGQLKMIERCLGRCPEEKAREIIRIDLDLLAIGDERFKPQDWKLPYVQDAYNELKNTIDMKFVGIIPARYASTRFPAKPLAMLGGKTVIERVYRQVAGQLDDAYVATDDRRIYDAVVAFGGKAIMTSVNHKSGTDRVYEALTKIEGDFDVVVNIQGDEPFIQPSQLQAIQACFADAQTDIATLVKPFTPEQGYEALANPNSPKVVVDKNMNALYFSRSIIPYLRGREPQDWLGCHTYYKHIGLYAYRAEVLREITALPQSPLELAESLEQLRWLENGYTIKVGISEVETIGIDTPEDLQHAEEFLQKQPATK